MNTHVLTLSCPDQPGIVAAVSNEIARGGGNILESAQYGDAETGQFCMRVCFELADHERIDSVRDRIGAAAPGFGMRWSLHAADDVPKVLIMVSRQLHCLVDLLYRTQVGELKIDIVGVVSNHRDAYQLVASHNVPFHHLPVTPDNKDEQEQALLKLVQQHEVEFIVLARYMQILSPAVCAELEGRVINIHHSFLPGFKGARPYHQASARGVKLIGATAHYVTVDLDEGPIIEQDVTRVTHADDVGRLVALGREVEQRVLARTVRYQSEHRIVLNGDKTIVFA
ncbi:MAG: formyltetrahydrofolate deformylase [Pseudomonadota bacterium]